METSPLRNYRLEPISNGYAGVCLIRNMLVGEGLLCNMLVSEGLLCNKSAEHYMLERTQLMRKRLMVPLPELDQWTYGAREELMWFSLQPNYRRLCPLLMGRGC